MTMPAHPAHRPATRTRLSGARSPHTQHGVVLIIALILLAVISLLAVTSLRNAGSSESIAGNVRITELATQAAEIALRYCESNALAMATAGVTPDSTPNQWKTPATWDSPDKQTPWTVTSTSAFVLPLALVNQPSVNIPTYKRPPECMVESQSVVLQGTTVSNTTSSFVITARGFGPEVAQADSARTRPQGTEVWLQSHIQTGAP